MHCLRDVILIQRHRLARIIQVLEWTPPSSPAMNFEFVVFVGLSIFRRYHSFKNTGIFNRVAVALFELICEPYHLTMGGSTTLRMTSII